MIIIYVEHGNEGPKISQFFIPLKNGDAVSEIGGGSDKRSIWETVKEIRETKIT